MCGIAGFSGKFGQDQGLHSAVVECLKHRGPDAFGVWRNPNPSLALLHRRLSILDLSPEGKQPKLSHSGRFAITFNGEIYNFQILRQELEGKGFSFKGTSDTEVMLAAFEAWGVAATLPKLVGMFAFGVWDSAEQTLWLARDRFGEKPLYYGWLEGGFGFSSEVKALKLADPKLTVSAESAALFFRFGYVPTPYSIYQGVYKLPPGSYLKLKGDELKAAGQEPRTYYSIVDAVQTSRANPFTGSSDKAVNKFEELLTTSIRGQMIADVPVGAFLSGGIDSSTIVALMQKIHSQPVKTFSIGFHEKEYDESVHAKNVARHLGTDHTDLIVTPREAMDVIPLIPKMFDEPFGDSSQIPTYLVAKLARQSVTVTLSGDAGDELFGGYERYHLGQCLWFLMGPVPRALRAWAANMMQALPERVWEKYFEVLSKLSPSLKFQGPASKIYRLARVLRSRSREDFYKILMSHWDEPLVPVRARAEPTTPLSQNPPPLKLDNFVEQMMFNDLITYLPDDILVKVDRAAMAVSLESRVPLLDHRVVEFAWSLPKNLRWTRQQKKWLLRQVLYRYVPRELVDRPKMGFGVPIDSWIRGPMRDWAEALLSESALGANGLLNPKPIRVMWEQHLKGTHNWQALLWNALMFQAWNENNSEG